MANDTIVELRGRLVGDGYTLPIATAKRLGVVMVGDGLEIEADGNLKTIPQKTYTKISISDESGTVNSLATMADDTIKIILKSALKAIDVNGVPNIDLNFGTHLDGDKPMTGTAIKKLTDSITNSLRSELDEVQEWLANLYISNNIYITAKLYDVKTDDSGYAVIPFATEENQIACVFVNGLLVAEGKEYKINDNTIQLTSSEFISGNDIVTFIVYKTMIYCKTGESKSINVSSEIYDVVTNTEGYALLPFAYGNKMFYAFINGVFAAEGEDYQIIDNGIQITNSEFASGEDVVTFVTLNAIDENRVDDENIDITSEIYTVKTDALGRSYIPLIPKTIIKKYGSTAVNVYINGMIAVADKDYMIDGSGIQLTNLELGSAESVVTFVVLKAVTDNSDTVTENANIRAITEEELKKICV